MGSLPGYPGATVTTFAFNANRTIASNAALGIFNLRDYGVNLVSGGDCTLALMGTIAAAQANGGGSVVIPPNFTCVISSEIVRPANVFIVGGGPSTIIQAAAGSNLDWMFGNGLAAAIDPRVIFAVNYRTVTVNSQAYTVYDVTHGVSLTTGGGYANFTLDGNAANQTSGLRHGILGNADGRIVVAGVRVQNFYGEGVSLWDTIGADINVNGTACGRIAAIHRACYNYTIRNGYGNACTAASFVAENEAFTISGGPTIVASPIYGKFIDLHHYASTVYAGGIDLLGIADASLTGVSADNTTALYNAATRNGIPTNGITSDTGASSGVTGVSATLPVTSSGGTSPNIALVGLTGLGTAGQVPTVNSGATALQWGTPSGGVTSVTASAPLASSGGGTPNLSLTGTVPVANGGTGLTAPGANGNVLTSNGTIWTSSPATSGAVRVCLQAQNQQPSGAGSGSCNLPYTATSGNLLVCLGIYTSGSITTPTGWTSLSNANGLFVFYRTASGTTADQFNYTASGLTGQIFNQEFKNAGTPYAYASASTGPYVYTSPQATSTGAALAIVFFNGAQNGELVAPPGWTLSFLGGSDFGQSRAIGIAWQQVPSISTVSLTYVNDDGNSRYCGIFLV